MEFPKVVVYTAIMGDGRDELRPVPVSARDPQAMFVCFSDRSRKASGWDVLPPDQAAPSDSRRCARWHKTHSHKLFSVPTIWMDGSMEILEKPSVLVAKYLKDSVFATYRHKDRSTLAEEMAACVRLRKDVPSVMAAQLERYAAAGYKDDGGLFETGVVMRRHREVVDQINEAWWNEIVSGSCRDQLSLPYVLRKFDVKPAIIAGHAMEPVHFAFHPHQKTC